MGWIGVDFDGTLAVDISGDQYHHTKTGKPVPAMVEFVKSLLAAGEEVRILTARVGPAAIFEKHADAAEAAIKAWCVKHLGRELRVSCCKDYDMMALYDDRAYHVVRNTGRIIGLDTEETE